MGLVWPRAVAGGSNGSTIHCIGITLPSIFGGTPREGIDAALLYFRSQTTVHRGTSLIQFAGLDSQNFNKFEIDSYTIIAEETKWQLACSINSPTWYF